mgnify:CR=1
MERENIARAAKGDANAFEALMGAYETKIYALCLRMMGNPHDGEDAAQKGQNYLYPHDYPGHWVKQQYLPDALAGVRYYEYGQNKNEQAAKAYWDKIKK